MYPEDFCPPNHKVFLQVHLYVLQTCASFRLVPLPNFKVDNNNRFGINFCLSLSYFNKHTVHLISRRSGKCTRVPEKIGHEIFHVSVENESLCGGGGHRTELNIANGQ